MSHAIVLGAGIAGVSTALQLQARGWSVVLLDRVGVGKETSFGNAGIIQAEAVEPFAMPRDINELFRIATGASNNVRYDLRGIYQQIGPLLRYWWHSAPKRHRQISAFYAQLINAATPEHQKLISQASADYMVKREGFRIMERNNTALDLAISRAERLQRDYGVSFQALSSSELARAEPSLKITAAGAIHWLDAWSVNDPGALVETYSKSFVAAGGMITSGDALSLRETSTGGWKITTQDGDISADHAVVALGPWTPHFLQRFGYRYPMIYKRGYHRHYPCRTPINLPLLDPSNGYLMAPMTRGIRITSGAELSAHGAPLTPRQLERAEQEARQLLDLGESVEDQPWIGTRPCMPDMLPVVGPAPRHKSLWLHFGHGHQGFTLSPVTGRMLAETMSKESPFININPMSPRRYGY